MLLPDDAFGAGQSDLQFQARIFDRQTLFARFKYAGRRRRHLRQHFLGGLTDRAQGGDGFLCLGFGCLGRRFGTCFSADFVEVVANDDTQRLTMP